MSENVKNNERNADGEAVKCSELLDCKCGFEAGKVGYTGGKSGSWVIRCSFSRCSAFVQRKSRHEAIEAWNEMQSAI